MYNFYFLIPALIPPPNFGFVEPDLYRSSIPTEVNFSFLQSLHLKTVIYLSLDTPPKIFNDFLKEQGIDFCQIISGEGVNVGQHISEQHVLDALQIILTPERYPLAVTCKTGMHRTGTVIGCFRKLQNWSLSNIIEEFRRYTGLKPSSMHEQFIELFDTDLVKIPSNEKDLPFAIPMSHKHQSLENDY